jgi:hypothetical protein
VAHLALLLFIRGFRQEEEERRTDVWHGDLGDARWPCPLLPVVLLARPCLSSGRGSTRRPAALHWTTRLSDVVGDARRKEGAHILSQRRGLPQHGSRGGGGRGGREVGRGGREAVGERLE